MAFFIITISFEELMKTLNNESLREVTKLQRHHTDEYTGTVLTIRFTEHLQNFTTNNYSSLTEIHTPKITVTTALQHA
jgi:hypothetical protein